MIPCDRSGFFRVEVVEFGLKESEQKAVAISLRVLLTEMWDGENWIPWREYDMEAAGDVWIVKKDGKLNERQAKAIMECGGWDGSLGSIVNQSWQPTPFQVEVKHERYKDEDRYRVEWINDLNKTPGASTVSNVGDDKLRELEARFGSPLRALSGNVRRNTVPPAGSKPAPPPKAATVPAGPADDGIRF